MSHFIDITGEEFGRWRVLYLYGFHESLYRDSHGRIHFDRKAVFVCQCKCGTVRNVISNNLRRHTSTSCGCKRVETCRKNMRENIQPLSVKARQRKEKTK